MDARSTRSHHELKSRHIQVVSITWHSESETAEQNTSVFSIIGVLLRRRHYDTKEKTFLFYRDTNYLWRDYSHSYSLPQSLGTSWCACHFLDFHANPSGNDHIIYVDICLV